MLISAGEALVDLVPEPVVGGGPLNVAVAAARLGAPAAFLGRTSTDVHGVAIRDHLASSGVDLRLVETGPEPTLRAVVDHGPPVSYRFEGEGTADENLEATDLSAAGPGPHVLHGSALGLFRGRTAERLAAIAEGHDGVVSVDPNPRPFAIAGQRDRWDHFHLRWRARCDLYRVSEEDLDFSDPGRDPDAVVDEVLAGRASAVLLGRPDASSTVFTSAGGVDVAVVPVTVADTVGAGDTFVGAVLSELWRLDRRTPERLAATSLDEWAAIGAFAARAAAITCSRVGADPPTRAEAEAATP